MSYKSRADAFRVHEYEMSETHAFIRCPFVELATVDLVSELAFAGYDKSENILWKLPDIRYNLLKDIHLYSLMNISFNSPRVLNLTRFSLPFEPTSLTVPVA